MILNWASMLFVCGMPVRRCRAKIGLPKQAKCAPPWLIRIRVSFPLPASRIQGRPRQTENHPKVAPVY